MGLKRAVFLDRDGVLNISEVINGKPYAPRTFKNFHIYSYVPEALQRLKHQGFTLAVVTNQPDVGNGKTDKREVDLMHQALMEQTPLDTIETCFHSHKTECDCRKPKIGLLLKIAAGFGIDPSKSFMVGDRKSDILAGQAFGCNTIFIHRGYKEPPPTNYWADALDLREAVNKILGT